MKMLLKFDLKTYISTGRLHEIVFAKLQEISEIEGIVLSSNLVDIKEEELAQGYEDLADSHLEEQEERRAIRDRKN